MGPPPCPSTRLSPGPRSQHVCTLDWTLHLPCTPVVLRDALSPWTVLPSALCASSHPRVLPFTTPSVSPHIQSNTPSPPGLISEMTFKSISSMSPCLYITKVNPLVKLPASFVLSTAFTLPPSNFFFKPQPEGIFPKRKTDHTKPSA